MTSEPDTSSWTDLLHSSNKLLEQAAPSAQFPSLQRNLDQLEALSKKLKSKTLRTKFPAQYNAATRLLAREGINAEQLAHDPNSFELKTKFEDVFPVEATSLEQYLQQNMSAVNLQSYSFTPFDQESTFGNVNSSDILQLPKTGGSTNEQGKSTMTSEPMSSVVDDETQFFDNTTERMGRSSHQGDGMDNANDARVEKNLNDSFIDVVKNSSFAKKIGKELQPFHDKTSILDVDRDDPQWVAAFEFPLAGVLYDPPHETSLPGHELVGGFNVPMKHVPLYDQIWKRYGHMATTKKGNYNHTFIGIVADFLALLAEMESTKLNDVTDDLLNKIERLIGLLASFEFNLSWLHLRIKYARTMRATTVQFTRELMEREEKSVTVETEEIRKLTQDLEKRSTALDHMKKAIDEGERPSLYGWF